ncbi:nicotinate-nucleotide pyrophosphorylase (carboxylating) [Propionibacterium cyclohexanicum]|uniref:Nicotinate-nucleotide pyrophosphorylase [carboxylating] n=1 Tax=Propionibacterium cyclohexanicum TaxID=64702 RepID=A0A1H9Q607_9ACTN|nr:carboxylating nicotinate-nucleotide diphosphorylase [Propionibacterium cyclohexanicum]SER55890.1 nicotinate-nucleotide pyrophosphorylase (carboxylating) [Propionibacterium cyclohexanicum]
MTGAETLPRSIRTALEEAGLGPDYVLRVIDRALDEDLAYGPDVTTNSVFGPDQRGTAFVVSRERGTLAGLPVAAATMHRLAQRQGSGIVVDLLASDGDRVERGDQVLRVEGPLRCLLTGERTMLNLLGHLSGIATATARWADALAPTHNAIRDTRKTLPGLRLLQKYAVRCAGGLNHRLGLGDAALIKDNHIAAAGSITSALQAVRAQAPGLDCEVECDNLDQVREAVDAGAQLILLDNMAPAQMAEAVSICRPAGVLTEASGGLTLPDAAAVGASGVDYVSVGALTHSATVLDLGLDMAPII